MSLLQILKHSKRRGIVTIRYPLVPIEVDELYRGKPELDPELCIACGACANACPAEALTVESSNGVKIWRIFYGRCIYCARCQEVCPVGAIKLTREFELASKSREDLFYEARFALARCSSCGGVMDVSQREVDYARELIEISELPPELKEELSRYVAMCQKCKRRAFAENLAGVYIHGER